jgi:protein-tyrosine phosphatase
MFHGYLNIKSRLPLQGIFIFILFVFIYGSQDSVVIKLLVPAESSTTPDTRPTTNPFETHSVDLSIPLPISFAWSVSDTSKHFTYDVSVSEDSVFDNSDVVAGAFRDTLLPVWNLKMNTTYRWKVSAKDSLGVIRNSPVFSFKTPNLWPRLIYVDGTTNVRDIGGRLNKDSLMIKQGLFYRSAEYNVTYNVTTKGLAQLASLGIVCEIDLRNSGENPQIVMPWLRRYIRPVLDNGDGMYTYLNGLQNAQPVVRAVFREMADKYNYPMIIHCRIGADRTGTIVAVLEALLGCSEQQMGEDYIWTSVSAVGARDTATSDWRDIMSYLKSFDKKNGTVQAGAWNYLQVIGVSVDELMAIRKIFLNDDKQPFDKLSVSEHINFRHSIIRHSARQYFINVAQNTIVMKKGVRGMKVYDLSGKKIWECSRPHIQTTEKIKMPHLAAKPHIVYFDE